MTLSPWFRDYDWDHYRASGTGSFSYATSAGRLNGQLRWSVAVSYPFHYPLGHAATLKGVQTIATRFDAKPEWLKRWLCSAYTKKQATFSTRTRLLSPQRFWCRLWHGQTG